MKLTWILLDSIIIVSFIPKFSIFAFSGFSEEILNGFSLSCISIFLNDRRK